MIKPLYTYGRLPTPSHPSLEISIYTITTLIAEDAGMSPTITDEEAEAFEVDLSEVLQEVKIAVNAAYEWSGKRMSDKESEDVLDDALSNALSDRGL